MKTLALADGDLVVGPQGHQTISGTQKISTELSLALGENLGNDRFHPQWGSTLNAWVGQPINGSTQNLVKSEVVRVVNTYIAVQLSEVLSDATAPATRSRYSTADVVRQVSGVSALQSFDTIFVRLSLRVLNGDSVTVSKAVNL